MSGSSWLPHPFLLLNVRPNHGTHVTAGSLPAAEKLYKAASWSSKQSEVAASACTHVCYIRNEAEEPGTEIFF